MKPTARDKYNRDEPYPGIDCSQGIGADQSFKDDADINVIMARYRKTGHLVDPSRKATREPFFEDVSMAPEDYLEAQTRLQNAERAFMDLPSTVRNMFENSPAELLEWLQDEKNHEEARKLGLMNPRAEPEGEPPASTIADGDTSAPKA